MDEENKWMRTATVETSKSSVVIIFNSNSTTALLPMCESKLSMCSLLLFRKLMTFFCKIKIKKSF